MDPSNKFKKIFEEVQEEYKSKFEGMTKSMEGFRSVYEGTLKKLDDLFRNKCSKSINWIEQNTETTEQGQVLKDRSKQAELEAYSKELEACVQSNDVGSQDLFMDVDKQMHSMSDGFNQSYIKCTKENGDSNVKNCFRSLIGDNINRLESFYKDFSGRLDNLNKKL